MISALKEGICSLGAKLRVLIVVQVRMSIPPMLPVVLSVELVHINLLLDLCHVWSVPMARLLLPKA